MYREYSFYIYIMSNYTRNVFYVGFSNDIVRRTVEHKHEIGSEFTKKYRLKYLVYYEEYQYVNDAIAREKEIKKWRREKKLNLIKSINPKLRDLSDELLKDYEILEEDIKEYYRKTKKES